MLRDLTDPAHCVIVEGWESTAADDAYRAWRATPEGASGLGDLAAARPVVTRLKTAASRRAGQPGVEGRDLTAWR